MKKLQKLWKNGAQEPQIEAKTAKIDEKSFLRARGVEKGGFFTPKCGPGWLHKRQRATAGDPRSAQRDPKGYPRGSQRRFGEPFWRQKGCENCILRQVW